MKVFLIIGLIAVAGIIFALFFDKKKPAPVPPPEPLPAKKADPQPEHGKSGEDHGKEKGA